MLTFITHFHAAVCHLVRQSLTAVLIILLPVTSVRGDEGTGHTWKVQPELLQPFWLGNTVYGESVLFVREEDSSVSAPLLYPPSRIVRVSSSDGATVYEEGRDYRFETTDRADGVVGGRLTLTADSRIPSFAPGDLRREPGTQKYRLTHRDGNGEILFGAQLEYHTMQTVVTYEHKTVPPWFPAPRFDETALPRSIGRLRRKDALSVVVLGDSISTGCNASGWADGAPFQPAYPELLQLMLQRYAGSDVSLTNLSVGGMSTPWGITMVDKVAAATPDLVVIAFGMNDASGRPADEFQANTQAMIDGIRSQCPDVEFILVAGMLGNRDWTVLKQELFPQFRDALNRLRQPGIAVADLTSVWTAFLERKRDFDLTGNGVNHPNDFGHRVYAQVLATLLLHPDSGYGTVAETEQAGRTDEQPAVLLIGDSIRLSYTEGVRSHLAGRFRVISPGANGGDSSNVRRNIAAWIADEKPQIILLNSGIHDTKFFPDRNQFQVTPEEYVDNWKGILSFLKQHCTARLIFVTSTPIIDDRAAAARADRDYRLSNAAIGQYNQLATKFAADSDITVLDLNAALRNSDVPLEMLIAADGVHLTDSGKSIAARTIAERLLGQEAR
ncbi:MAG: SGNH/GDSL hydrolase family protein [Planctomycetaceae bacterium]|nr:SGNH/GDSL hydrolase family protein [Planctomycetaceae bacterium]